MYFFGSIIGALVIGAIPGFIVYCIVKDKTKSKKKGIIALAIVMALVCVIKVGLIDNYSPNKNNESGLTFGENSDSSETATEQTKEENSKEETENKEPEYDAFGDIKIQLNCGDDPYMLVESAEDLSFSELEYNDGEIDATDWSNDEKQAFWDNIVLESPYETTIYQKLFSSDVLSAYRLATEDSVYDSLDDYVASLGDEMEFEREDFTLDDIHACVLYLNSIEDNDIEKDESFIAFYYKDYFYLLYVIPMWGDAVDSTEMFMGSIVLD